MSKITPLDELESIMHEARSKFDALRAERDQAPDSLKDRHLPALLDAEEAALLAEVAWLRARADGLAPALQSAKFARTVAHEKLIAAREAFSAAEREVRRAINALWSDRLSETQQRLDALRRHRKAMTSKDKGVMMGNVEPIAMVPESFKVSRPEGWRPPV